MFRIEPFHGLPNRIVSGIASLSIKELEHRAKLLIDERVALRISNKFRL